MQQNYLIPWSNDFKCTTWLQIDMRLRPQMSLVDTNYNESARKFFIFYFL